MFSFQPETEYLQVQGLVFAGGGERKGIDWIPEGILGIFEGMFGRELVAGRGGKLSFGTLGMVGKLGSGGKVVGLGRDGWGRVGMEGNGGNVVVGFGKLGMFGKFGGVVCKRRRAAWLKSMLKNVKAAKRARIKPLLKAIAMWNFSRCIWWRIS